MKKHLCLGISVIVLAALCAGCSDLKKENGLTPTGPALSAHGTGWDDSLSSNFHGAFLKNASYNAANCQECHAPNYHGGTSGVGCFKCHQYPHAVGWVDTSSANFHGAALRAVNFDLQLCQTCHAQDYQEGTSNVGCMRSGCHVDANGNQKSPEACNTCHGTFSSPANDIMSSAPPRSVTGGTSTSLRGVGAHQGHFKATLGKALKCQECHNVPTQLYAAGHLDTGLQAVVVFHDTLANLVTASGTLVPRPSYDANGVQCNNTYCHGNWRVTKASASLDRKYIYVDAVITGNNYSPKWAGGASEAACGTCHGLPPKGHLQGLDITTCGNSGCHAGVVDANGNILDPTKHINGKIDLKSSQRNF